MNVRDRSNEFHAAVESIMQRGTAGSFLPNGSVERAKLISGGSTGGKPMSKSEFARKAMLINQEIIGMSTNLHKLAQLAKKKSLFDDQPTEINHLIHAVKQKIPEISRHINDLSNARRQFAANASSTSSKSSSSSSSSRGGNNKQVEEHSANVITSLQSKLATSSNEFKNILEIRTQNMKDQKSRRDQYSMSPVPTPPAGSPMLNGGPLAAVASPGPSTLGGADPIAKVNMGSVLQGLSGAALTPGGGANGLGKGPASAAPGPGGPKNSGSFGGTMAGAGFGHDPSSSSLFTPAIAGSSPLYNPQQGIRNRGNSVNNDRVDVVLDISGGGNTGGASNLQQQQQQQMLMYNNSANMEYINSRSEAIESIESTIAELGQIYQHFAQILAGQREMIQRIDDNVQDVEMNVTGAHDQLVRYFQNISTNRWLMIRIFAILVVFFLIFVAIT